MGNTTNYAIPYPEQHDMPDGAGQMKAIADRVDQVLLTNAGLAVTATYTPTFTNFTLGNGQHTFRYTRVGPLIYIGFWIGATATPTTAFVSGAMSFSLPNALGVQGQGVGTCTFKTPTLTKHGGLSVGQGTASITLWAVRQTDLAWIAPDHWATAWAASAELRGSICYPVNAP